jgi:hypothetical protein
MSVFPGWFGALELPFLFLCVCFAFLAATALSGGLFGRGMLLVAWGFLVMGIGHLHMQIESFWHVNLLDTLLGSTAGSIVWVLALITTWALSGLGFYSIYRASKGG